ncbi:MAG: hypothetical protein A2086_08505 [Spirochaetes bacterium GWD1_27_9]|nr:MAG: hypothetical protein A2Z98_18080 [Spirochaetes bacterium GWB1_27_13]OHD23131.1 MAG: hypothetical protein A2Y34_16700 [Spirochaetes bacterium GWC1_27_15]OHD40283.1 MAG: hypothetical protein A2086_08505 [Spirochaetes bacterium GWD1_27_9]
MNKYFIYLIFFVLIFSSCLTLPRNIQQKEMGVVVFKVEYMNTAGIDYIPFAYLILKTKKENKDIKVNIYPINGYIFATNLPIGFYDKWESYLMAFDGSNSSKNNIKNVECDLIVTKDTITIFPLKISHFYKRVLIDLFYEQRIQYANSSPLNEEDMNKILADLKKNNNYYSYKKVRFGKKIVVDPIETDVTSD